MEVARFLRRLVRGHAARWRPSKSTGSPHLRGPVCHKRWWWRLALIEHGQRVSPGRPWMRTCRPPWSATAETWCWPNLVWPKLVNSHNNTQHSRTTTTTTNCYYYNYNINYNYNHNYIAIYLIAKTLKLKLPFKVMHYKCDKIVCAMKIKEFKYNYIYQTLADSELAKVEQFKVELAKVPSRQK